jgi:hypothetical protein
MRAHEAYVYDAIRVVDPYDQSILVAANIEHDTTIAQDARVAEFSLNIGGRTPIGPQGRYNNFSSG